jgi:predicted transcriptional regulator
VDRLDRRSTRQRASADPVARYLGELQAQVMEILWQAERGLTVRELSQELARRRRKLAYTTVLTLARRLWSRGILHREQAGRGYRYTPAKGREEFLISLSDELIDRLLTDFGEVALARLDSRLGQLDHERQRRLQGEGKAARRSPVR